jgi:carbohydrate kinase (thermoresistant glucokinase family)
MVYVIMGVAGCGKTTIGRLLAQKLKVPFYDADDFHSQDNVLKMKSGIPLDDAERLPWLAKLSVNIARWNKGNDAVLACSALKESYRQILSSRGTEQVLFIHLRGDRELISSRLAKRNDHYFSSALLESQFNILEPPSPGIAVQTDAKPEEIAQKIHKELCRLGFSGWGIEVC